MYNVLHDFTLRPAPYAKYTAKELWTRPHLARQMLRYHLDQDTALASRPHADIDAIIDWIDSQIDVAGKKVCDLGCGPGLYASRFAVRGADVTGIDFSRHSLDYAQAEAARTGTHIRYIHADYLEDELPTGFDVVTLIYYDYCALSPEQRRSLLAHVRTMLKPGGRLVLDVIGIGSLAQKQESTLLEANLMGGFWAEGDYVGIQRTLIYPDEAITLDRYLIVEPTETWQIFNWFQYVTPSRLIEELHSAGYAVETLEGSLTGKPLTADSEFLGVIATS